MPGQNLMADSVTERCTGTAGTGNDALNIAFTALLTVC
jgi:hypothetical protein